jgi:hypothetical protein
LLHTTKHEYVDEATVQARVSSSPEKKEEQQKLRKKATKIAAVLLLDYERARPPTLPTDLELISMETLRFHNWRYSRVWVGLTRLATVAFFLASCYESEQRISLAYPFALNAFAILVFLVDMGLQRMLGLPDENWTKPMLITMAVLLAEMIFVLITGIRGRFLYTSIAKPIALFYSSDKARNALEALRRIAPIVTRVLALELLLILSFAAVACRLYSFNESFATLSKAWLSLFQLSTTVVNPSMWMPLYEESRKSAFFFVIFDITATLYLHSLVLSVVFQTYIQASTDIHERSVTEREETIRLAFLALQGPQDDEGGTKRVQTELIRDTLHIVRPHYNAMKINALIDIVDPSGQHYLDYPSFRTKVRQALNAAIRSTPSRSLFAYFVEILAAFVAVSNFVYVILLTSEYSSHWFDIITYPAGIAITVLGLFELIVRANPFHLFRFTPTTRLNGTFDGLAALAATVSCWGIIHNESQLKLMITGRAIDMIRIMRFQRMFRDVVRRSGDVLPTLAGPIALVATTHHLFVYLGMSIWGGSIHIGANEGVITPLYDLNNFNSYWEGLVTMFHVQIVNDWHAIADVYLHASKHSSPLVVYPFFVGANLVCVSIMLNCLTAFFVGAFVTKLDDVDMDEQDEVVMTRQKAREFKIDASTRTIRRIASYMNTREDLTRTSSSETDVYEYDVYERENFDKVMQTVAGGFHGVDSYAKEVCDMLEVFEQLSHEGEDMQKKHGFLVCCQQTMNRYGNRRFQVLAEEFMETHQLHSVISEMHANILSIAITEDGTAERTFVKGSRTLRISGALLREQPAISMFVSTVI